MSVRSSRTDYRPIDQVKYAIDSLRRFPSRAPFRGLNALRPERVERRGGRLELVRALLRLVFLGVRRHERRSNDIAIQGVHAGADASQFSRASARLLPCIFQPGGHARRGGAQELQNVSGRLVQAIAVDRGRLECSRVRGSRLGQVVKRLNVAFWPFNTARANRDASALTTLVWDR
jgi:hypothetical protein